LIKQANCSPFRAKAVENIFKAPLLEPDAQLPSTAKYKIKLTPKIRSKKQVWILNSKMLPKQLMTNQSTSALGFHSQVSNSSQYF
jgi:hypothetical protein